MELRPKVKEKVALLNNLPMLSRSKKSSKACLKPAGPTIFTPSTSKRTSIQTIRKGMTSMNSTLLNSDLQQLTPGTSQIPIQKYSSTSYLKSFKNLPINQSSCKRFRSYLEARPSVACNHEKPLIQTGWFSKTQTGTQQGSIKKHNQDSHLILPHFSSLDLLIFAVFDGHGASGHQVSSFLSSNFRKKLETSLEKYSPQIKDLKILLKTSLKSALASLSEDLLKNKSIDSVFSGSTGVVVAIHSDFCICANVGDSRAVLGNFLNGSWVVYPLSKDHKPEDFEERMRIESLGGLVEPIRGIN